jgi:hypothetical protein
MIKRQQINILIAALSGLLFFALIIGTFQEREELRVESKLNAQETVQKPNITVEKIVNIPKTNTSVLIYSLLAGDNVEERFNVSRITGNRERYVQKHPNHFHYWQKQVSEHVKHPVWQKVEDAVSLVKKYDWVWFLDATDAFIVNGNISVHDIINEAREMYPGKEIDVIISKDCSMINCGSFFISGSKWSQDMVKYWWSLGRFDQKQGGYRDAWFREQDALNFIIESNFMNAKERTAIVPQRSINAYAGNTCGQLYQPGDFVIHEPNNGAQRLLDIMKKKNVTEF